MKFILGMRERMEGINIAFPMTIPAITPNPAKYSSSTIGTLTKKTVKGSQKFRLILTRDSDFLTTVRVASWKTSLHNENITETQVRNAFKLAQWKIFDAEIRDYMLNSLCRKTLFNSQLDRVYPNQKPDWYIDNYCQTYVCNFFCKHAFKHV